MAETGFMGAQQSKSMSADMAEKLWPQYQATGGNLSRVRDWALANGIDISKPTLDRLARNFGWKEKLSATVKNKFAAAVDTTGELRSLLAEVTAKKNGAQKLLDASPADFKWHKQYGFYLAQILDIRKALTQEKYLDRDQLLVDLLKGVVQYLVDKEQTAAVEFLNENLEDLAYELKEKCLSRAR